eukprot:1563622-Pyramimonas_sp.AAC.1
MVPTVCAQGRECSATPVQGELEKVSAANYDRACCGTGSVERRNRRASAKSPGTATGCSMMCPTLFALAPLFLLPA